MYKIGWFSSGRDKAARDLLAAVYNAIQDNYIKNCEIDFVFINKDYGESPESDALIDQAQSYGIKVVSFSSKRFKPDQRLKGLKEIKEKGKDAILKTWREEYDKQIIRLLNGLKTDLNVLAGYMLIFSKIMVKKYLLINLHPSPPGGPQGAWQDVIWELIRMRADKAGCMIHLVTEELDRGPPISCCAFSIKEGRFKELWRVIDDQLRQHSLDSIIKKEYETHPLFQAIREEEAAREPHLLIETLKMFSENRIAVNDDSILLDGKFVKGGISLTDLIEERLRSRQ
ncbi:MAG: formyltransferase family protein [Candidatus Bathyarchaeia archaeon]